MRRVSSCPLWIGHRGDVRDFRAIFDAEITALVDVAINEPAVQVPRELAYCRFPLLDGAGNARWMLRAAVETTAHFLRSGANTLVICSAGISRSPAIAAVALALAIKRPPEECLAAVVRSGPCDISPSLWEHLQELNCASDF